MFPQVKTRIANEYDGVKNLKSMLHTFKLDTSIDVPLGVKRPVMRDDNINDMLSTDQYFQNNDPQVWPPPNPVDHSYTLRYISQTCFTPD